MRANIATLATCSILLAMQGKAADLLVKVCLPPTPVDPKGDMSVFSTPIAYRQGDIFSIDVEPPAPGGLDEINLRTVIRKGVPLPNNEWKWHSKTIDSHTIRDQWHAQGSLGLDSMGFIHVAYGMHNMPWQYSVSKNSLSIRHFHFLGEKININDLKAVKYLNHSPFPDSGNAAIPGNQITYPMFFNDRKGALYITYRFATRPARSWPERGFAGAIAKYNVTSRRWHAIGGLVPITRREAAILDGRTGYHPLIFQNGYSVYLITLAFGPHNGMHVFWNWRPNGAGINTILPSYAYSPDGIHFYKADGSLYKLPITIAESSVIGNVSPHEQFYAPKSAAVLPDGKTLVVLQEMNGLRVLYVLNHDPGTWSGPSPMPDGATQVLVDKRGRIWAFASGLRVFMRRSLMSPWHKVGRIGRNLCFPFATYASAERRFIIHAITCDFHDSTIVSFQY